MTSTRRRRGVAAALVAIVGLLSLAAAWVAWRNHDGGDDVALPTPRIATGDAQRLERGAYLARAGNCMGCHTARGGLPYAGGRAVATPFGNVYAPNLTPDEDTGLGRWSASDFWRAMHHGRSRDGRLLYPAFPYPNFTLVTREDANALFAYLRSLPPVRQANRSHELRFPYNLQAALAVWRALYFQPARFEADPGRSADWNRGRYLVDGLGHCMACHAPRNAWGATRDSGAPGGALVSSQRWYAPSLSSAHEAGVAGWSDDEVVALLKTGVSPRGSAMGPMAEVVFRSTQYLDDADLRAMAHHLRTLAQEAAASAPSAAAPADVLALGANVYKAHCADCHGERGQGAPGIYPPLAGNRAVVMDTAHNVVKALRQGGFPPTTAGNPRPFGMPPFAGVLSTDELAAVATFIRQSWGNRAGAVTPLDVLKAQ